MIRLDIQAREFQAIAREFDASERDLRAAFSRALGRTSRTMQTQARKALREGLDLRAASILRTRMRLRRFRPRGADLGAAQLWVGLNDLPATAFKGTPRATASGVSVGGRSFDGAFIGRGQGSGSRIVFQRRGRERLPIRVVTAPIKEAADAILDRQVYAEAMDVMMRNFRAEVRARTIYGVGS